MQFFFNMTTRAWLKQSKRLLLLLTPTRRYCIKHNVSAEKFNLVHFWYAIKSTSTVLANIIAYIKKKSQAFQEKDCIIESYKHVKPEHDDNEADLQITAKYGVDIISKGSI